MRLSFLRGPLRRAFRGALIIAVLTSAVLFGFPEQTRHFMQTLSGQAEEPDPVTVYPYNFTPYGIEYAVGSGLLGYLPADTADGKLVLKQGYTPSAADGNNLPVRWRYVTGEHANATRDSYPYGATLALPARPSKTAVLTLRFYPDGRVAARYTEHPETAASGNVDAALPGQGWKSKP
jgi:hypothetical protein